MLRVLFVCLGNICRSPAAETVFRHFLREQGLEKKIFVDSCGTSSHHEGDFSDPRMKKHAQDRGYEITCRSRGFRGLSDFEKFDYIVTMDNQNYSDIINWPEITPDFSKKVYKFVDFCPVTQVTQVEDPYYGGPNDFEATLDIIEEGSKEMISSLSKKL